MGFNSGFKGLTDFLREHEGLTFMLQFPANIVKFSKECCFDSLKKTESRGGSAYRCQEKRTPLNREEAYVEIKTSLRF